MTATSKALASALFLAVVVAGVGWFEWQAVLRRRTAITGLERQIEGFNNEIHRLREERSANAQAAQAAPDPAAPAPSALEANVRSVMERIEQLKKRMAQAPGQQIPELQLLTDNEWFRVAQEHPRLDTDRDFRRAMSELRELAVNHVIPKMRQGLKDYLAANQNHLPAEVGQLAPYIDPPVAEGILDRYEMLKSGVVGVDSGVRSGAQMIGERTSALADPVYDWEISMGTDGVSEGPAYDRKALGAALRAYRVANPGPDSPTPDALVSFFQSPAEGARYLEIIKAHERDPDP